ncbi:MAG: peptidoglycan DD-metalloendopeptidase family protein [Myxococcaceae bacterium]
MSARWTATALALAALVSASQPALAQPEDAAAELDQVQEELTVERAALATLKDQKVSVLEVIEVLEQRARATQRRAALLGQELLSLKRRRDLAKRQEELARTVMAEQLDKLSPRLRALYRIQRRRRLDTLLSAKDFASLMWTSRAMSTLLEQDLKLLRDTQAAVEFQQESQRTLERLEGWVAARAQQVEREQKAASEQQVVLGELLGRIEVDAKERARLVRELQQAERRLSRLVEDFEHEVDDSGFGALKGSLPWPTAGMIEVAFGKVVNPRFNTVTFQKGIDIRAPEGTPVRAIAPGKVVHAGWMRGYGNLLIVDHGGGHHSLMAHLAGFSRATGDDVVEGDVLGQVGDTGSLKGAYLYFEIRKNGIAIDPTEWLGAR